MAYNKYIWIASEGTNLRQIQS